MDINKKNDISEKSIRNLESSDFFEGNHLYVFLYKKAEKLASAVYMITNLVPDGETLRNLLREKSVSIFSGIMQLQKMSLTDEKSLRTSGSVKTEYISLDSILFGITETVSLFEIAHVSGYVSEMNFRVLKREYIDLGNLIKSRREDIVSGSVRLSENFFDVPDLYETHALKQSVSKEKSNKSIKDIESTIKDIKITSNIIKSTNQKNYKTRGQKDKIYIKGSDIRHNSRRNTILELLQNKMSITVKDATDAIDGCSSKTLQRELLSLVNEGILKKKGERRWSTYSIT